MADSSGVREYPAKDDPNRSGHGVRLIEISRTGVMDVASFPRIQGMRRRPLLAGFAALALPHAWAFHVLPDKFEPERDAAADLQQALALAQAQHKMVFVDVGGEWCSWCHVFDRFVASHAEVQKTMSERYILVKVNYSPQQPNRAVLSRFPKPKGYPHFYVLDASGKLLASQASDEFETGSDYNEAKVLEFLRRQQVSL